MDTIAADDAIRLAVIMGVVLLVMFSTQVLIAIDALHHKLLKVNRWLIRNKLKAPVLFTLCLVVLFFLMKPY